MATSPAAEPLESKQQKALGSPNGLVLPAVSPLMHFYENSTGNNLFVGPNKLPSTSKSVIIAPERSAIRDVDPKHVIPYVSYEVQPGDEHGYEYAIAQDMAKALGKEEVAQNIAVHVIAVEMINHPGEQLFPIVRTAFERIREVTTDNQNSQIRAAYFKAQEYIANIVLKTDFAAMNAALVEHMQDLHALTEISMREVISRTQGTDQHVAIILPPNQPNLRVGTDQALSPVIRMTTSPEREVAYQVVQHIITEPIERTPVSLQVTEAIGTELPAPVVAVTIKDVALIPTPVTKVEAIASTTPEQSEHIAEKGGGFLDQIVIGDKTIYVAGEHSGNVNEPKGVKDYYFGMLKTAIDEATVIRTRKDKTMTFDKDPAAIIMVALKQLEENIANENRRRSKIKPKKIAPIPVLSFSIYCNTGEDDLIATFGSRAHIHAVNINDGSSKNVCPPTASKNLKSSNITVLSEKSKKNIAYLLCASSPIDNKKVWGAIQTGSLGKLSATAATPNVDSHAFHYLPPEDKEQTNKLLASLRGMRAAVGDNLKIVVDKKKDNAFDLEFVRKLKAWDETLAKMNLGPLNIGHIVADFPVIITVRKLITLLDKSDDKYIDIVKDLAERVGMLKKAREYIHKKDLENNLINLPPKFYEFFDLLIDFIEKQGVPEAEPVEVEAGKRAEGFSPDKKYAKAFGEGVVAREVALGNAKINMIIHTHHTPPIREEIINKILTKVFEGELVKAIAPLIESGVISFEREVSMIMADLNAELLTSGITADFSGVFRGENYSYLVTSGRGQQAYLIDKTGAKEQQKSPPPLGTADVESTFTVYRYDNEDLERNEAALFLTTVPLITVESTTIRNAITSGDPMLLIPNEAKEFGILYLPAEVTPLMVISAPKAKRRLIPFISN